ncbi:glycosyl hydrolase [Streptacidiphilus sp. N1-10]|uniref:Glycosyl hydrolase n=2 Tax=Streptacidiphilus jeojiensis TaxID=3229225 RepID=A0ABV6XEV0_9ACTN
MTTAHRRRRGLAIGAFAIAGLMAAIPAQASSGGTGGASIFAPGAAKAYAQKHAARTPAAATAAATASASPADDGSEEADEISEGAAQWSEARTSPGVVAPGAYGAAWNALQKLPSTGGSWQNVTNLPYNSDDPRYRDYDSNSSGGAGLVTGRMAALAADDEGHVYAGSAGGGVWRSSTGGGKWTAISDALPAQSTGALALDSKDRLWLGTGEATTNADAYLGSGVYVLDHPEHGSFTSRDRVGGTELQSTSIHELRFSGTTVWAATSEGLWSHSTVHLNGPWKLEFAPNPAYMPGGSLANDPSSAYKNIVSDIAFDPRNPGRVVVAAGWRSGDTYNGFYTEVAGQWQKLTSLGDLPADAADIGSVTFARSADGSRYYAIDQSPAGLNAGTDALAGIFVSKSGSPFGPWTRIATSDQLAASGSALTDPGAQGWYDQFLQVDPNDPNHVFAGLEEVFETKDGGTTWTTPGPYWNFYFPCWSIDPTKQTGDCSQTTHADQHAVAVGSYHGKSVLYVGNDGGMYKRPLDGAADASGHATDWTSLNDGTIDTLQYYSVGVGKDLANGGVSVTGGLQDNGQSILRSNDTVMGSNFGGDGGMTLNDPANGCNIAQEYVYLEINVTQNCAANNGLGAPTTYNVPPPDNATSNARFIAPFTSDLKTPSTWVAGGENVWVQTQGFAIRSSSAWTGVFDLGAGHVATAVAASGGKIYAAWCGPCNSQGFTRGIAVGNADGTGWQQITLPATGSVPNRYLSSLAVDPNDNNHVYLAVNGFSRSWNEGPGAGVGHLYESRDGGLTWKDISSNLPDIPADSIALTPGGGIALGTDLGALYRAPGRTTWKVIGQLPAVAVTQVVVGPDNRLYAATHGRGIYAISLNRLH